MSSPKGFYGLRDEGERYGLIGIVVATQPRGEVASILYSPGDPLYIVGRELYESVPLGSSRDGKSKYRYKDQLSIGDQVEFGVDEETWRVKWMQKSPQWLKIDCSGGVPIMETIGVVTDLDGEGLRLWGEKTEYIAATQSQMENAPKDCPMWTKIKIMLDYGDYEGEEYIPISDFRPVYWFELVNFKKRSVSPELGVAMLRKTPWIKAMEGKETECKPTESKEIECKPTESYRDYLETVFDQATKAEEEMLRDDRLDEALTSQLKLMLGL